jgi:glycine hydroxymethyltransferase
MKNTEMAEIGTLIADILLNPDSAEIASATQARVAALCKRFPVYR